MPKMKMDLIIRTGTAMKLHRLALWTGMGSGLEYYAFISFALQANALSLVFFHHSNSALTQTFFIFAAGSIMTLMGGFFLGWLGDALGRKKILLLSISLMTVATVMIGLLPTHLPYGLSIVLLILCRLIQGISVGSEIPGAMIFVYEHAHKNKVGFLMGILFLGIGLGAGVSTGVNALVSTFFTPKQILDFAWRIPFLLAFFLGAAGYLLRRNSSEPPAFETYLAQQRQHSIQRIHLPFKLILKGAGLILFPATLVSVGLYLPSYWINQATQAPHAVFLALMFGFLISALLLPLFGKISDHFGRKQVYCCGAILSLVILPVLMHLLTLNISWGLYLFNLMYYLLIVIMASCYPAMLAGLFAIPLRYRCVALSYSGTYAVAGTLPFLVSLAIQHGSHPRLLLLFLLIIGCISLYSGLKYFNPHSGT